MKAILLAETEMMCYVRFAEAKQQDIDMPSFFRLK